jgi:hypothetical protein
MHDPLALLWPHLEMPRPLFSQRMVECWPEGVLARLQTVGFVRQAETARRVVCPGCYEGHIEDVVAQPYPDGSCRFFVYCPEVLRAEVPPNDLRQWTIDFDRLAGALAQELSLRGRCLSLLPDRLWRLGKATWRGALRDVLLARGLAWRDAPEVVGRIGCSRRPIVLVPQYAPLRETWAGCEPAIVTLAQVASFESEGLAVDAVVVAAMVADADATWHDDVGQALDERQLRRLLRAQRSAALGDEVLVAAYKQYGSYRKAAEALIAQGVETDRWGVERAVRRAGGAAAIRRDESSLSVVRMRASQRHDGRRIVQSVDRPR